MVLMLLACDHMGPTCHISTRCVQKLKWGHCFPEPLCTCTAALGPPDPDSCHTSPTRHICAGSCAEQYGPGAQARPCRLKCCGAWDHPRAWTLEEPDARSAYWR